MRGATDLEEDARPGKVGGHERGGVRAEVRTAGEVAREWFELSRGIQEQRRRIVPIAVYDGDLTAQERRLSALEPIEWIALGDGEELLRFFERSGEEARLGGG